MSWRQFVGYWSVCGLATKSTRWEQSMNQNLVLMTEAGTKATVLMDSSAEKEDLSIQQSEKSAADEAKAAQLEEEAASLLEKSDADFALAAAEEADLDEVNAQIALEEEKGAVHAAAAAADEVEFETEMAAGTADASEAFELEAEAHGEEVGITVCEFIPLLDIVCDVVGGVTAVGLELTASGEAAKASSEFAAAAAAKADEEREIAAEAKLQARAAENEVIASGLRQQEKELEEKAEAERLQGEENEAAAKVLYDQAGMEELEAAQLEAQATTDEESAMEYAEAALLHGVKSCWDALLAVVCAALALLFFGFRMITSYVIPGAGKTLMLLTETSSVENTTPFHQAQHASYFFQHILIFAFVSGFFSDSFHGLEHTSIKARGGVLLLFGFISSSLHTLELHVIPECCLREHVLYLSVIRTASRLLAFLCIFVLEILILWVTCGQYLLQTALLEAFGATWFRFCFAIAAACYIMMQSQIAEIDMAKDCCKDISVDLISTAHETISSETDSLLHVDVPHKSKNSKRSVEDDSQTSILELVKWDFSLLKFPFEVLILSCMVVVLSHCTKLVWKLWPKAQGHFLQARPIWLVPILFVIGFLFVAMIIHRVFPMRRIREKPLN